MPPNERGTGLSALRIGVAAGAAIGAALVLISLRGVPSDGFGWFIVALSGAVGGYLGCEVVIAFKHVRHSPVALLKAFVFLIPVSLLVLAPYSVDAFRAHRFLADADSALGILTRTYYRGGKHLWMNYAAGDSSRVVTDMARRDTYQPKVGDTARVFWDKKVPTRATIGRPAADWPSGFRSLVPVWLIGGVLFLAYGVNATRASVPEAWQRPLHLLRAYLGAAVMADVGFWLTILMQEDLGDPRLEVAQGISSALAFGALFCFIFTVVLGTIGLLVLLERRWTSVYAFALCGIVFGAVGGLIAGPDGLLIGSISGLFAGLAFRGLYFRGGEQALNRNAAA